MLSTTADCDSLCNNEINYFYDYETYVTINELVLM